MTVTPITIDAVYLTDLPDGLDPIHVFWQNLDPGQGYCTILCYGSAWTVYFGGMGACTIQKFFADASTQYLVEKMVAERRVKFQKQAEGYLRRVIDAVKKYLNGEEAMPV